MDEEEKKTATALLDQTADQAIQGPNEQTMSKEDLQSDSFRMFSFKVGCSHISVHVKHVVVPVCFQTLSGAITVDFARRC